MISLSGLRLVWICVFLVAVPASAEDLAPITVEDSAIDEGFKSEIDLRKLPPSASGLSAAEVARKMPGVALRSLGGIGDFSTLSIRGSTSTQLGIYQDGAALTQPGVGSVDLATLFLLGSGQLIVHRGFAPLSLGPEAFAGALELKSGKPPRGGTLSLSYGSFAMRELSYTQGTRLGAHSLSFSALYFGKAGDFPYLDDKGTPLVSSDDTVTARRNNSQDALFARVAHAISHWRSEARVLMKDQGAPAPSNVLQDKARYRLLRPQIIENLDAIALRDDLLLEASASLLGTWAHYDNVRPSIYTAATEQNTRELTARGHALLSWSALSFVDFDFGVDLSGTGFIVTAPTQEDQHRNRFIGGGALVARAHFFGDRLLIDAGVRVDALIDRGRASPSVFAQDGARVALARSRVLVQPQLGVSWRPLPWLALAAHIGRRERAPSFYELFGADGQIRGNPTLVPEAQWSWDLGVRAKLGTILQGEVVYAESRYDALITLIYAGLDLPRAMNVGRATMRSFEVAFTLQPVSIWGVQASYGFLPTTNNTKGAMFGRQIAGRALHQARGESFVKLPLDTRVSLQALTIAGLFLDETATLQVPTRVTIDAEVRWNPGKGPILFVATVKNILDQTSAPRPALTTTVRAPIVDFLGFPLPGRSVLFTLIYAFDEAAKALDTGTIGNT